MCLIAKSSYLALCGNVLIRYSALWGQSSKRNSTDSESASGLDLKVIDHVELTTIVAEMGMVFMIAR